MAAKKVEIDAVWPTMRLPCGHVMSRMMDWSFTLRADGAVEASKGEDRYVLPAGTCAYRLVRKE